MSHINILGFIEIFCSEIYREEKLHDMRDVNTLRPVLSGSQFVIDIPLSNGPLDQVRPGDPCVVVVVVVDVFKNCLKYFYVFLIYSY